jgi:hypothetical protein
MKQTHVTASEGRTFKRKVDGHIMGNEMYLGLFIDGTEDVIENYEEIDDPENMSTFNRKRRVKV